MEPWTQKLYQLVVIESWNKFNLYFFYDYLYHAYNDIMWSFFEFQNKWRTRHSKEGGYGALNPYTNTSMLGLKSLIWFIINSSMTFYLYHADNVVLWSFFQIQNNWRPRKLKQRRNKALNLDTNSSMLCLKIRIDSIIISSMIFYLYREDNCQTFIKFYFNKLSVYTLCMNFPWKLIRHFFPFI